VRNQMETSSRTGQ